MTPATRKRGASKAPLEAKAPPKKKARGDEEKVPSPNDPTERKVIKYEDLLPDLSRSYKGTVKPPEEPERPKKHRPWVVKERETPLNAGKDLPEGWHLDEHDLDPMDYDAQIERCIERIRENIRPHIFIERKKEFERAKAVQAAILDSEEKATTPEVAGRLYELRLMKEHKDKGEFKDEFEQICNIEALIDAYESGKLEYNYGLVTYWSKGKQISKPRPFDWDESEAISKHCGPKSFWVEGLHGPGASGNFPAAPVLFGPHTTRGNYIGVFLTLRIPGITDYWNTLEMVYDTGASWMSIYHEDLRSLLGPHPGPVTSIGTVPMTGATGVASTQSAIEVEATILNANGERVSPWTRVMCLLLPGAYYPGAVPRLDGPFIRECLYTASAPDAKIQMRVCNQKTALVNALPALNLAANPAQMNPIHTQYPLTAVAGAAANLVPILAPGGTAKGMPPPAMGVP